MSIKIAPKGLEGIFVSETKLSHVDGKNGELTYSGYNINELIHCSYEEICYLLLNKKLPNKDELNKIENTLKNNRDIPGYILNFICDTAKNDHPMSTLRTSISMLSVGNKKLEDKSENNLKNIGLSLISKIATITGAISRVRNGLKPLLPKNELSHSENLLYMLQGKIADHIVSDTLDKALVLHAEHSFNASTFSNRVVASSLSDMISSVTAAIGSLKGALHGGANTEVMKMLLEIDKIENVDSWIEEKILKKEKIMGFGHRVYKVIDPRAKPLRKMSEKWGDLIGNTKWFLMSKKIEKLMKIKKNINPNVDFYSASTYYSMGINIDMFTVIFAASRIAGWVSHYIEQMQENRIMRPLSLYSGEFNKKFQNIQKRK